MKSVSWSAILKCENRFKAEKLNSRLVEIENTEVQKIGGGLQLPIELASLFDLINNILCHRGGEDNNKFRCPPR